MCDAGPPGRAGTSPVFNDTISLTCAAAEGVLKVEVCVGMESRGASIINSWAQGPCCDNTCHKL